MGIAGDRSILRLANRGGRLQDGKERAAKERNLLTGDDRACAVAQPRDVLEDRRFGAKIAVLLLQQITQLFAMLGRKNWPAGHPAGGVGTGGVKGRERFASVREIEEQTAETGQDRNGITLSLLLLHRHSCSLAVQVSHHFRRSDARSAFLPGLGKVSSA